MGMHKIEITMVDGHGCDRNAKEGEPLVGCGRDGCPDCEATAFVKRFAARGSFALPGTGATLTHWPDTPEEVVDDLVAGIRKSGEFK